MEDQSFKAIVSGSQPVLIDFFAEWCAPCKAMKPILEQVKGKMGDKVKIIKIDVDKNQQLAMHLDVRSIPTLMIYKSGKKEWQKIGVSNAADLESVLNNLV